VVLVGVVMVQTQQQFQPLREPLILAVEVVEVRPQQHLVRLAALAS
jgi:hypothetical protein